MKVYKERFINNLRELCRNKAVSCIAKDVGLNQQTLQRYLHGENEITLENLCKLADYFDISLDELVGRREF